MGVGSFTSTPTRNYKVVHSFVRPFLFQTFQTPFFFNADMSSTMSGFLLKLLILSNKNFDTLTRITELQTSNSSNFSSNADMSSTMSGFSPKRVIPIEQKLQYPNAERWTRNTELQTLQTLQTFLLTLTCLRRCQVFS